MEREKYGPLLISRRPTTRTANLNADPAEVNTTREMLNVKA